MKKEKGVRMRSIEEGVSFLYGFFIDILVYILNNLIW